MTDARTDIEMLAELLNEVGGVAGLIAPVEEVGEVEDEEKRKLSLYVPRSLYDQIRSHSLYTGIGLSESGCRALRLLVRLLILPHEIVGLDRKGGGVIVKREGEVWPVRDDLKLKTGPAIS